MYHIFQIIIHVCQHNIYALNYERDDLADGLASHVMWHVGIGRPGAGARRRCAWGQYKKRAGPAIERRRRNDVVDGGDVYH